jgi:2',3'-cyclic-nucleotide 2'-phosphodiesterase (5'-nucleotidase family)
MGGVARRATMIKRIRAEADAVLLLLDAGNTLFDQPLALQSEGRVVVEAMNAMGYDAMAVGVLDLAKGVEVLRQRATEARFPILSANLVSKTDGKPILSPYTVIRRDGLRFGILGVTDPDAVNAPGVRDAADVLDPVETVRTLLPELRSQSDVLIVLSRLGLGEDRMLARTVPGIDIIVGGKTHDLLRAPEVVGTTIITQMGYDGKWLGRLDADLDAEGHLSSPGVEGIGLAPDIPDDPELAALIASWQQRFPEPTHANP